jgi:hypothetical protein
MYGPREHWILPDGEIIFCDGEASVETPNHDHVVVTRLQEQLVLAWQTAASPCVRALADEVSVWEGDTAAFRETMFNWWDENWSQFAGAESADDDLDGYLQKFSKMPSAEYDIACTGKCPTKELPREYAVANWDWVRQQNTALELKTPDRKTLKRVADALWEIYDEQVESALFAIDVYGTRRFYMDVPYDVLASGCPQKLLPYRGGGG